MGGGVEVAAATTCLHWSHPVVSSHHQSPSCRRLGSAISSPSFRKSRDQALSCRVVAINPWNRSSNYSSSSSSSSSTKQLMITRPPTRSKPLLLRRAFSASLDGFFSDDEELAKQIQELAIRFDEEEEEVQLDKFNDNFSSNCSKNPMSSSDSASSSSPPWDKLGIQSNIIERKANSVDLPLSLRLIKKKNQLREGFAEAGESAYCSVKKAFSSMVFIIRELHSYSLQALFYDDLQGVLVRVQREMHASFVWLFQQIFSHTPTLMVYVMILLANFTVHSMAAHNTAIAASPPVPTPTETASTYSSSSSVREELENDKYYDVKFDSSTLKTYSNSYSVGGGNGSGGKIRPTSSGTDGGDGQFKRHRQIVPDEIGTSSSTVGNGAAEEKGVVKSEDEARVWNEMVDEAWRMRAESLDQETMEMFVSPVTVEIESDQGYVDHYFRTEVMYLHAMAQDPHNTLLLSNYAQFLYLVVHDHDRAEEYFKRAVEVKPADAEALRRYATFLWLGKNDLCAAEETFLEAIEADPGNTYHAANYAHFLWNTGGEDTCFPLSSPNDDEHHNAA
ncbi:hypothetical protein Syun_000322 [Stephania yunnanensis]|uniref:Uncharacterized protein n=1 Tax=Stephania yunnanensis TaxID=152371 RepID=A0AAP0LDE8_9MAGN